MPFSCFLVPQILLCGLLVLFFFFFFFPYWAFFFSSLICSSSLFILDIHPLLTLEATNTSPRLSASITEIFNFAMVRYTIFPLKFIFEPCLRNPKVIKYSHTSIIGDITSML